MATIITRETGATAKGSPLTNAELDANFVNLNTDVASKIPNSEKGSAGGVATLDSSGKVVSSQLPSLNYVPTSEKGAAGGVATLNDSGLIPTTQLPSYVDDVLEAASLTAFPATGETGKIYIALDTNKTYRWSGSAYVFITSGAVDSVAGKTGVVTLVKGDVGLSNADNTSDADKPVSTATQTALDLKANLASPTFSGTVSGISKAMVDLGNVDNTSDASKPVSTATQTALNAKQNTLVSGTNIKTINGTSVLGSGDIAITSGVSSVAGKTGIVTLAKADVGLGNVDNTSDANKPVSTATQTALNAKQNTLVSGTSIKTINGTSVLGSGNIVISGGGGSVDLAEITQNVTPSVAGALSVGTPAKPWSSVRASKSVSASAVPEIFGIVTNIASVTGEVQEVGLGNSYNSWQGVWPGYSSFNVYPGGFDGVTFTGTLEISYANSSWSNYSTSYTVFDGAVGQTIRFNEPIGPSFGWNSNFDFIITVTGINYNNQFGVGLNFTATGVHAAIANDIVNYNLYVYPDYITTYLLVADQAYQIYLSAPQNIRNLLPTETFTVNGRATSQKGLAAQTFIYTTYGPYVFNATDAPSSVSYVSFTYNDTAAVGTVCDLFMYVNYSNENLRNLNGGYLLFHRINSSGGYEGTTTLKILPGSYVENSYFGSELGYNYIVEILSGPEYVPASGDQLYDGFAITVPVLTDYSSISWTPGTSYYTSSTQPTFSIGAVLGCLSSPKVEVSAASWPDSFGITQNVKTGKASFIGISQAVNSKYESWDTTNSIPSLQDESANAKTYGYGRQGSVILGKNSWATFESVSIGFEAGLQKIPSGFGPEIANPNPNFSQYGISVGSKAVASGQNAMAIGYQAKASAFASAAIGDLAQASGQDSLAIGRSARAWANYSVAIGPGTNSHIPYSFTTSNGNSAGNPTIRFQYGSSSWGPFSQTSFIWPETGGASSSNSTSAGVIIKDMFKTFTPTQQSAGMAYGIATFMIRRSNTTVAWKVVEIRFVIHMASNALNVVDNISNYQLSIASTTTVASGGDSQHTSWTPEIIMSNASGTSSIPRLFARVSKSDNNSIMAVAKIKLEVLERSTA